MKQIDITSLGEDFTESLTEEGMNNITKDLEFNGSPDKILVSAQIILEKAIQKAIEGGWIFQHVENYKMKCACGERIGYDRYEADNKYCSDCGKKVKTYITKPDWYIDGGKTLFLWNTKDGKHESRVKDPEAIIFNHDFAKALWSEEWEDVPIKEFNEALAQNLRPYDYRTEGAEVGRALHRTGNKGWEYHLQQMVIADDPIKYLGENI